MAGIAHCRCRGRPATSSRPELAIYEKARPDKAAAALGELFWHLRKSIAPDDVGGLAFRPCKVGYASKANSLKIVLRAYGTPGQR